ncbi:Group 1 glycosyl transferase [Tumidithrix helvetica PCC 7403]|uniref:glycosyltransferase family 4 protein n=1 Tax=Tumidithrix helvetica TaxID=3457545 RepID=UPI003CC032A0
MIESDKIYHCSETLATAGGGVKTYVQGLFSAMPSAFNTGVIATLVDVDQSQFKLLHLHEDKQLPQLRGECPTIFTAHNHDSYCPSGTKYFSVGQVCCDRPMSYLGCTWGHIVDGCGSRRPQRIVENFQRAYQGFNALKQFKIPVIANSDYVRSQFIRNGLAPEQVVTLRYGITIPKVASTPLTESIHRDRHILFAGRIVPDKGLDWLLKALQKLDRSIHLDIAGEGWYLPKVQKLAVDLGVSDRITWHGWCSGEQLEALYERSFSVVFPSVWPEPAGIITLEAYARFRPIIASAVGGIPEHVKDGETGILVPANDIQKLAAAITELSENYPKAKSMGEVGNTWFHQEFTLAVHTQRLMKIYDRAIVNFTVRLPNSSPPTAPMTRSTE